MFPVRLPHRGRRLHKEGLPYLSCSPPELQCLVQGLAESQMLNSESLEWIMSDEVCLGQAGPGNDAQQLWCVEHRQPAIYMCAMSSWGGLHHCSLLHRTVKCVTVLVTCSGWEDCIPRQQWAWTWGRGLLSHQALPLPAWSEVRQHRSESPLRSNPITQSWEGCHAIFKCHVFAQFCV